MIVILSEAKNPRISLAASPRLAMADTQITELAGRHYLISQLLAGGVRVATPVRDHGIDLIAYVDQIEDSGKFFACPIQLKTAKDKRFSLYRKYEKFPNLLMVYAWNISSDTRALYALTYYEAEKLLKKGPKGTDHTKTDSWTKKNGGYHFEVNDDWLERLRDYQMKPEQWKEKILEVSKFEASSHALVATVKE
jgi:hypothetical protein